MLSAANVLSGTTDDRISLVRRSLFKAQRCIATLQMLNISAHLALFGFVHSNSGQVKLQHLIILGGKAEEGWKTSFDYPNVLKENQEMGRCQWKIGFVISFLANLWVPVWAKNVHRPTGHRRMASPANKIQERKGKYSRYRRLERRQLVMRWR